MADKVSLTCDDAGVAVLTLRSPETRNALTDVALLDALLDAIARVEADDAVRVAILTGEGPAFSSGGNLKDIAERRGPFAGDAAALRQQYRRGIQRLPRALWALEVPTIAAVNGPAYGAGCDLAFMCDLRVAAKTAVFAENFVKLGLIPGDGGAWFLPRQIGLARAAEMIFTGDSVDAEAALAAGMVNRVVDGDALMDAARALAARIAVNPPTAVRMAKRLLREAQHARLDSLLELSAIMQGAAHNTAEHQAAATAALDRIARKRAARS